MPSGLRQCDASLRAKSCKRLVTPTEENRIMAAELAAFLQGHGYTDEQWGRSGLDWVELKAIGANHMSRAVPLQSAADVVIGMLTRFTATHATRARLKSPDSLMEKILRKKLDEAELPPMQVRSPGPTGRGSTPLRSRYRTRSWVQE